MIRLAAIASFAFCAVAACSSEPSRPPPAGNAPVQPGTGGVPSGGNSDASTEGGVDGGDGADAGGACNDVVLTGTLIDRVGVVGDPPAMNGGTVVAGTYDLTAAQVYVGASGTAGPTGISFKSTIVVDGTTIQQVLDTQSSAAPTEERTTAAYATSGATMTVSQSCPTASQQQLSYTATDTALTIVSNVTRESLTFTKR